MAQNTPTGKHAQNFNEQKATVKNVEGIIGHSVVRNDQDQPIEYLAEGLVTIQRQCHHKSNSLLRWQTPIADDCCVSALHCLLNPLPDDVRRALRGS